MAKLFASVTLNSRLERMMALVRLCKTALGSRAVKLAWTMPLAMLVAKTWGAFALSITIMGEAAGRATRAAIKWVVELVDSGGSSPECDSIQSCPPLRDPVDAGKHNIPNTMFGILMDHHSNSINMQVIWQVPVIVQIAVSINGGLEGSHDVSIL